MHDALVILVTVACLLAPFGIVYLAFNALFAWDDRRWRKAWRAFYAANVPRPAVLGNVAPNAGGSSHGADLAAGVLTEAAEEVASDD